jgi:hypothetical protein
MQVSSGATPVAPNPNEAFITWFRELTRTSFWGNVTIKIQHGNVIHVVREESIPADKLNRNTRGWSHDDNPKS